MAIYRDAFLCCGASVADTNHPQIGSSMTGLRDMEQKDLSFTLDEKFRSREMGRVAFE